MYGFFRSAAAADSDIATVFRIAISFAIRLGEFVASDETSWPTPGVGVLGFTRTSAEASYTGFVSRVYNTMTPVIASVVARMIHFPLSRRKKYSFSFDSDPSAAYGLPFPP
jgi:hypothetical protein